MEREPRSGEDPWSGRASEAGSVDDLRAEFESVDAFFQALLGVRSACADLDRGIDALTELSEGSTAAWAQGGAPPPRKDPASGDGDAASLPAAPRGPDDVTADDVTAALLGLLALRRCFELGSQSLTMEVREHRDPSSSPSSTPGGSVGSAGSESLLR